MRQLNIGVPYALHAEFCLSAEFLKESNSLKLYHTLLYDGVIAFYLQLGAPKKIFSSLECLNA